ncbi:LmbE family protein [Emticicia oligotrophica DSM 17448]|uniref:LmbE family protein n=1 Tax=Emticicia oligotrophica (strain DSM 17448 / CIP 109782 / MTCC 6937 / GPTSA100-15) TaxID=929562 RepID=A0ABM5MYY5_EMTOG|nr:PIG-L family deacetylase [Emticicia oligotrophica]AFK02384.1 LmbE family protein [Emticicia oligotrophica DSM 17448]
MKKILVFILLLVSYMGISQGPRVLIVTAHPDDETMFPATIFKITHEMKGTADLALITDGSGGYNGLVASSYYGKNLTDSTVGRTYLPLLRKKELLCSGEIMGIRNFYFFDQVDDYYQLDPLPFLAGQRWDIDFCDRKLDKILKEGQYDYVICLIPSEEQHAHHKTASILALRAVQRMKDKKPVILGGRSLNKNYTYSFTQLEAYPETQILSTAPVFYFDRSYGFGENNKHSYMIVADWVKACHKTQSGDMNSSMHKGELETFWYFDINGSSKVEETRMFFDVLRNSGFPTK